MDTVQILYRQIRQALRDSGIEAAGLEARILLRDRLGLTDSDIVGGIDSVVPEPARRDLMEALDRRLKGEPLSRIRGRREFRGLEFIVTPDVLDPRPDTEILVEAAVKAFSTPPESILDLGIGSGCILIALLHEWREAQGTGIDISEAALAVARENAHINGVAERAAFIKGSWTESVTGTFDLIVSNPPYIPSPEIANLQKEVRNHDPILALDGGPDGLDAYRRIILETKKVSHAGTKIFLEAGISQAQHVARLAEESGLQVKDVHPDLAGIPRVVEISSGEK